jgi:hypothetical protein
VGIYLFLLSFLMPFFRLARLDPYFLTDTPAKGIYKIGQRQGQNRLQAHDIILGKYPIENNTSFLRLLE